MRKCEKVKHVLSLLPIKAGRPGAARSSQATVAFDVGRGRKIPSLATMPGGAEPRASSTRTTSKQPSSLAM